MNTIGDELVRSLYITEGLAHIGSIHLSVTLRCPVECGYCIRGSTKRQQPAMSLELAKEAIDTIAHPPFTAEVTLTGGEPFVELELVRDILDYAYTRKVKTSIITSAVTAHNYNKTIKTLQDLQQRALTLICVSVDDEHQKVVPLQNVANVTKRL